MSEATPTPWELRVFDDAQVVVLGPATEGRQQLIATFTGDDRQPNTELTL